MGLKLGLLHHGNNGLGVFEREVLREVLGTKRSEVRGGWENCTVSSFMVCAADRG